MARVKMLEKGEVDPSIREVYQQSEDRGTKVLNLFKALAHSPKIARDWNRLGITLLYKGYLPPRLRELAILRVGNLARADYEWTHHVPIGLKAGLRQEQIDALPGWSDSAEFDEQESAVLRYTDEVAVGIRASDETFARLKRFLSEREIVELTVTIGYYGMVSRTLEALQVDNELFD
ncbi:MAG: carboxymuconolactone decarboxylase family protein [Proteobacteria bacterium]|nr:carboxymuconolactone decarboxylase family protein [Pseudomonadota bacterium]